MKPLPSFSVLLLFTILHSPAQDATGVSATASPAPSAQVKPQSSPNPPAVLSSRPVWESNPRSAHETVWSSTRFLTNRVTGIVQTRQGSYIALGNGLNFKNPTTGKWQKSQPMFVVTADGLQSQGAGHSVVLKKDIAQVSAITVTSSDGVALQSTPLGLSLNDGQTAVVIAEIKSSTAVLLASNIVVFPDCFSGAAKADVRVVLTRSGVEVDVVLNEQLAVSPVDDLQMDAAKVRLEVVTEGFQSQLSSRIPAPQLPNTNSSQTVTTARDPAYSFGTLRMGHGRAFLTPDQAAPQPNSVFSNPSSVTSVPDAQGVIPVLKSIEVLGPDQREFLIESTRWPEIAPKLESLQPSSVPKESLQILTNASATLLRPANTAKRLLPSVPILSRSTNDVQLADSRKTGKPGLVLDWTMVEGIPGYFFDRQTYLIEDWVDLEGGRW
jgi:hypothetical protein